MYRARTQTGSLLLLSLVERKGEGSMVQAVKFWGCFVFVCSWGLFVVFENTDRRSVGRRRILRMKCLANLHTSESLSVSFSRCTR